MSSAGDLSLDDMLDMLRRNGYSPLGVPRDGGITADPALVRHHAGMATTLVLPVYGDATVLRTRCSLDTAQPGLLIKSVEFRFSEDQATVARWLLEHDGLLPAAPQTDQP